MWFTRVLQDFVTKGRSPGFEVYMIYKLFYCTYKGSKTTPRPHLPSESFGWCSTSPCKPQPAHRHSSHSSAAPEFTGVGCKCPGT